MYGLANISHFDIFEVMDFNFHRDFGVHSNHEIVLSVICRGRKKTVFSKNQQIFPLRSIWPFHNFNSSFQLYFHKEFIKIADI